MNKTKVICTVGPKTQSIEMLGQLVTKIFLIVLNIK